MCTEIVYLSISEVARLGGVSQRVIRYHESIGLLATVRKGNQRWFNPSVIDEVILIKELQLIGFTLNQIGVLLNKQLTATPEFRNNLTKYKKKDLLDKLRLIEITSQNLFRKLSASSH
jgi:DNA-binding transcriptional MerR regulator